MIAQRVNGMTPYDLHVRLLDKVVSGVHSMVGLRSGAKKMRLGLGLTLTLNVVSMACLSLQFSKVPCQREV